MKEIVAVETVHVAYYNVKKTIDKVFEEGEIIPGSVVFAGAEYFIDQEAVIAQIKAQKVLVREEAEQQVEHADETLEYDAKSNYIAVEELDVKYAKSNGKVLKFPFRRDEIIPIHMHQLYIRQDLSWELQNGLVKKENSITFDKQLTADELFAEDQNDSHHIHVHGYAPDATYVACQYVKIPFQYENNGKTQREAIAFYANDVIPHTIEKREFAFTRQDLCRYLEKGLVKIQQ